MRLALVLLALCDCCHAASVSLAWDSSESSDVLEYIVRYGTSPGTYTASESAGLSLTKTISGLPDGFRYYFVVIARNTEGESDSSNEVNYRQPTTNPPVQIMLQAESSKLYSPMILVEESSALGGKYIVSTNEDSGLAMFMFTAPFVDEYVIWGRVFSGNDGTDSFYVSHNKQPEDVYDTVYLRINSWQWTQVNGRGGNDKGPEFAHSIEPRLFIMYGTNEIDFRGRERGTLLDAILITNDRRFIPGPPPSPQDLQLTVEH